MKEKSTTYLTKQCPNVKVWTTLVELAEPSAHLLHLANGKQLKYDKLCICTGGRPKVNLLKVKLVFCLDTMIIMSSLIPRLSQFFNVARSTIEKLGMGLGMRLAYA